MNVFSNNVWEWGWEFGRCSVLRGHKWLTWEKGLPGGRRKPWGYRKRTLAWNRLKTDEIPLIYVNQCFGISLKSPKKAYGIPSKSCSKTFQESNRKTGATVEFFRRLPGKQSQLHRYIMLTVSCEQIRIPWLYLFCVVDFEHVFADCAIW